ncbi:MAG TPA: P1 family peptidase [Candidatus Limnocylindrales bacterium]|nr:P1 family peptidase [Candidatus Limnocylindrales bacterium]
MRARDLGILIGRMEPGPLNAITDVAGVRVGHTTLIEGDGPLEPGRGPVRTGVTVIVPHDGDIWTEPMFAGAHRLNGNGELTGLEWIREAGMLAGAIGITNTHSVGVVHDAIIEAAVRAHAMSDAVWALPVAGETYDGALNDINGFHVRPEHVHAALGAASDGPVGEGNVGGGTGMICHEFKGGIGTSSRLAGEWMVGVLVQANYGARELLRIDGVPVGAAIPRDEVPSPWDQVDALNARAGAEGGSIIGIVATDAPLLPHQCTRLAQRVGMGVARMGSYASHGSGDLFCAFATGNRDLSRHAGEDDPRATVALRMVPDAQINPLLEAVAEATEEAIVNALVAATTMVGRDGITAHALDHDRLRTVMGEHGRLVS